jgi:hemerythrin-like domain-containing protein
MKAISELMAEHEGIKMMLGIMTVISRRIAKYENIDLMYVENIADFLSGFADKCHHGKEESILFIRFKDKKIASLDKILPELLEEHAQARTMISLLNKTLQDHWEGNESSLIQIGKIYTRYAELMNSHIEKENTVLFPVLENEITPGMDEELYEAFEKLEAEVIGLGKHSKYHAMLEDLRIMLMEK